MKASTDPFAYGRFVIFHIAYVPKQPPQELKSLTASIPNWDVVMAQYTTHLRLGYASIISIIRHRGMVAVKEYSDSEPSSKSPGGGDARLRCTSMVSVRHPSVPMKPR